MKELSLHILDIAQNSISAGANIIKITVDEDTVEDKLAISVEDNGRGMDEEIVEKVKDPFFTSRSTRKVGLGIPLLLAAANRCGGGLKIESSPGKGTKITATFRHGHIDRAPLGDIWDTIAVLVACNEDVDFVYTHVYNGRELELSTIEIKNMLKEVPITSPEVVGWITDYIKEGIKSIYGGVEYEIDPGTGGNKKEDS